MSDIVELKLSDLIEVELLQKIQNAFSRATGLAALTTEANGKPITEGSNFTRYCMHYTRQSELGRCMCEECDRFGAEETLRTGHAATYVCHSGLVDFSAPVVADGHLIGCFIGGQALYEAPEEEKVREIARLINVNEDEYWEAINEIPIIPKEAIDSSAEFLYTIAEVLSEIAYSRYIISIANEDLARAAKMQGDFLANMSHEIRTPMNAVIGFAEMALREDLPDSARNYIQQIKSSGNALLTIINDILDYSKIESGKMEIIPVDYEPLSMIDDVTNIIMTRLVDKDVELLLDVNPNIPSVIYGDNIRIRQILINICNNATKFTHEGYVKVFVDFEWVDDEYIEMYFAVEDTGIGIKPKDIEKVFNSFQQVDSKRNRSIEGSGLGLTICRNLLKLMGSDLELESEYGKGSTFSFRIKQRVVDSSPSIVLDNPDSINIAGVFKNSDVADDFYNDASKLGLNPKVMYAAPNEMERISAWYENTKEDQDVFFIVEQPLFDPEICKQVDSKFIIHNVVLVDTFADLRSWTQYNDLLILRKPLSVMNLSSLLNHKNVIKQDLSSGNELYTFTAPEARVLIVDDNMVNLTVAQGLMGPLKMTVDLASSGKEALRMISINHYDVIYMDHMMPEMDGIETTQKIRKEHPECKKTPIIALSANAVSGAKEMFIEAGMNDFVAKPIEVRSLVDSVRRYLPKEKMVRGENFEEKESDNQEVKDILVIADLDTTGAIKLLGSEALYMNVLRIYYESIDSKANRIKQLYEAKDILGYTTEVHALKSSSRQIGAMELGELAFTLEKAGKNEDIHTIERYTDKLLTDFLAYKEILKPYVDNSDNNDSQSGDVTTDSDLAPIFEKLISAIELFDFEAIEEISSELENLSYSGSSKNKFNELKDAISVTDLDECVTIINNWH